MDEVWSVDEEAGGVGFEEHEGHEHDSVGTVDVQILLSWSFETADPSEVPYDVREAA
jgi:hypothetical protein